ncbi:MAG TPA: hypothetical protein DCF68_18170 [Cyanothece sp. UBA12306]|nr:hypothetical protein [Cyanothece sp. UBA12306]
MIITMMLISPGVSFAQDKYTSSSALEALEPAATKGDFAQVTTTSALEDLEQAIDFEERGDIVNAEFFYKRVIDLILANKELDSFILAKQNLAQIKQNRGEIIEANQLKEEAEAGEKALGSPIFVGGGCGDPPCRANEDLRGGRCRPCIPG